MRAFRWGSEMTSQKCLCPKTASLPPSLNFLPELPDSLHPIPSHCRMRHFWKNLPTPLHRLLHPWMLLSLALHGLVLMLPLVPASAPEPEEAVEESITVDLTELPPTALPIAPPPVPPPTVAPTPPPSTSVPTPAPPNPQVAIAPPSPEAPPPIAPTPSPQPTPAASPTPQTSPTPLPSPTPQPSPTPLPSPTPTPFADFPHAEGAVQGCHDSEQCWQVADTQWRSLSRSLSEQLTAENYQLRELDLGDDAGRRVYELTDPAGEISYLSLISTLQGTVYLLTSEPLTGEEMDAIAGF